MSDESLFRQQCFIGGRWVGANDGSVNTIVSPTTGATLGTVPNCGRVETAAAIAAAAAAFGSWRKTTARARAELMAALADALTENAVTLGRLLTLEMGKPLAESQAEIAFGVGYLRWFSEEAKRIYGEMIPSPWQDRRLLVTKEPVGVVGAITPWNFPNSMIARKLGAALAAGCTIVIKPAPQTPYSALAIAALAEQVGFPPGVINVITGAAEEIGAEMCENPCLRKLTFTGSTAVGKRLAAHAGRHMKRISMELGGNAPFIVFDDADIDAALRGAMLAKFRNAGQTCVCANRILVHAGIHDAFAERLRSAAQALNVGSSLESGVELGPLVSMSALEKVESHVADAVSKGAHVLTGGSRHRLGGSFFEPTVLAGMTSAMLAAREETFGPVAPLFRFDTEEQAIEMANDTEAGLACYFYTRDLGRAWRVMEQLRHGLVGINEGMISTEVAPFGGIKDSGIGREGSKYGVEDYLDVKYACFGGLGV